MSNTSSPETKTTGLSSSPPAGGGIREFIRRVSHSGGRRPGQPPAASAASSPQLEELVAMGFPRSVASRQLHLSGNDPKRAAEYLVHAAHPKMAGSEAYSHPDCPVCVRELENVRISEARRPSLANVLDRVRSRGHEEEGDAEPHQARRGSVSAMLRRPSISAALARMTSRDVKA